MSWMGSECRHAGRVSECIGHAEMALCRYNKSYCAPKLELIFPRGNNQANTTEKHSLLFFSGSPEALGLSLPPPPPCSTQKPEVPAAGLTGVQGEGSRVESHTHNKSIAVGFGKLMHLIMNFRNCIKLKSMMQQIHQLTVRASDRWPLPSRSKVLNL